MGRLLNLVSFKLTIIVIAMLTCQMAFAQLSGFETYRQRADACLKAHVGATYAEPPQLIDKIDANSYVYIYSYASLTAQISLYRASSTSDITEIGKRLAMLIKIQEDMNAKFTPYVDMKTTARGVEQSWWYAGYMMYSYLYIKDHLIRYNIKSPQLTSQLTDYETQVRKWIAKFDFTFRSHDEVRIFANLNYPKIFACYLATELWPDEVDAYGKPFRHFRAKLKSLCDYILHSNFHYSVAEVDAVTYGQLVSEPLKMLAEYTQDPELKKHAQITFQYLLATIGADYNNGLTAVCPERAKGLEIDPNGHALYRTTWLFYGFYKRIVNGKTTTYPSNMQSAAARKNVSVWLSLPGSVEASESLLAVQESKDSTITWHDERENGNDNEKKYVLPNYVIASTISERDGSAGRAEGKNNMVGWRNPDKSVDWISICQENRANTRSKDGENPNSRIFHYQKTLVGVYDVPVDPKPVDPEDDASNFYKPFLPLDTTAGRQKGYLFDFSKPNWVFCHTGYMMYGVAFFGATEAVPKLQTQAPQLFGGFAHYFLLNDRKGAWILETAEISESPYKGKPRVEQLQLFRDNITRTTQPRVGLKLNDPTQPVSITYNSLTSGKLELQFYKSKSYKDEMKLNGVPITAPYSDSIINSLYMRQASGSDVAYMGKTGSAQSYSINWTENSPPYIHPRVKMKSDDANFTYLDRDRPLIIEEDQTSVDGLVQYLATDPDENGRITYDIKYLNGNDKQIFRRGVGSSYRLDLIDLTKDTTILFTISDAKGLKTIDTVKVYVTKRPKARFDRTQRNQFLPTEKIQGIFIGKDIIRKILDLEVNDSTGNRVDYKFPETKNDSIIYKFNIKPFPVGNHKFKGVSQSWIRSTGTDTLTIYIRNIVITSPTPKVVLFTKNKTFSVTGKMAIPVNATGVRVQILVFENGVASQTITATVSGTAFKGDIPFLSTLAPSDKVKLVAQMTYTQNGTKTELSYPVDVLIDNTPDPTVTLAIKAFLQGGLLAKPNQTGYALLMRDDLRAKKLIPAADPYSGRTGFTHVPNPINQSVVTTAVLSTTGNNAIVDWVFVELRDKADARLVVATQSALIQRDGDVVSVDGVNSLTFVVAPGSYHVALRHRNHLPVKTSYSVNLGSKTTLVDFTKATTPVSGVNPRVALIDDRQALWAGDANGDGKVISVGDGADINMVSQLILRDAGNTRFSMSYSLTAYEEEDIDLNGTVIALGSESDIFLISSNILKHPANTSFSPTFVIRNSLQVVVKEDIVADRILLYQRNNGGWRNGNSLSFYDAPISDALAKEIKSQKSNLDAYMDNGCTTNEIGYLVKLFKQTNNKKYLEAAQAGINYLLTAQYANGGWPQNYPDLSSYHKYITYNDGTMVRVITVMKFIAEASNGYEMVDIDLREKAKMALAKGIDCILKTQYKQAGNLTVWCAQHDSETLLPAKARAFELPSLSGAESVGIVSFLMSIDNPSTSVKNAVKAAVKWLSEHKLVGIAVKDVLDPTTRKLTDRIVVEDPNSTIWARFYDLTSSKPFFTDRDSFPKDTLAEISKERRIGYAYYGKWPATLLAKDYPAWLKKWGN